MDQVRDASGAAPGSRVGTLPQSVGEGASRVHEFTREEHHALHQLTLCPFTLKPMGYRTLIGSYVRKEIIEGFVKLGLIKLDRVPMRKNPRFFAVTARITERGRMVADELGAPGVFPLPGFKDLGGGNTK